MSETVKNKKETRFWYSYLAREQPKQAFIWALNDLALLLTTYIQTKFLKFLFQKSKKNEISSYIFYKKILNLQRISALETYLFGIGEW
jgi:hypothetical protein